MIIAGNTSGAVGSRVEAVAMTSVCSTSQAPPVVPPTPYEARMRARVLTALDGMLDLRTGWDGEGGTVPGPAVLHSLQAVVGMILRSPERIGPSLSATHAGGAMFDLQAPDGRQVDVWIRPDAADRLDWTHDDGEGSLPIAAFPRVLAWLTGQSDVI